MFCDTNSNSRLRIFIYAIPPPPFPLPPPLPIPVVFRGKYLITWLVLFCPCPIPPYFSAQKHVVSGEIRFSCSLGIFRLLYGTYSIRILKHYILYQFKVLKCHVTKFIMNNFTRYFGNELMINIIKTMFFSFLEAVISP